MKLSEKLAVVGSIFSLAGIGMVVLSATAEAGHEEGRKEGRKEGREEGRKVREEGREQGRKEGQANRKPKPRF